MKRSSSRCILTILACIIFCPTAILAQKKEYPSLLWEITGNGLTKPSYLYGTMHVSKKVAFHLSEAFFDDLKSADVVALESNPETWLSELMTESMSMVNTSYFRSYYGAGNNFYEKAFDFTVPGNKYIKGQIALEPDDVNNLLYRFNGYSGNFEEYTYLDLFIFQSARKSEKKVVALEDFETNMQMVIKASLPDDETKEMAYPKRKYTSRKSIEEQIEDAYRNGDLDVLDSLNKFSYTSKNFEKYMIVDRNVIMANHMDSIMKKQSLFTAVGAAHLPGNAGVISLLRKMGYTVKPVSSVVSKKSIKTMDGFEALHTPLVFHTQFATDSSFTVDAPGHLFPMEGFDALDSYLYTDMVNGSYYMVKRIRTYGALMKQDKAYQQRRIDSILYESIPGKIIHKEQITTANGDPGFDIVNKTRRGDMQRYRIYVSDQYISIFKVSGNGDYVEKSDADKFFRSITFKDQSKKGGWAMYSPASGGYEVSLPSGYAVMKPAASSYQKERVVAADGADCYIFTRSLLTDYTYIEEDTFELSQLAKNFYESLNYELQEKKFNAAFSFPCIDVTAKKKNSSDYLHFRIVIKDQEYFLLACTTTKKEAPANFFSSLKFKPFVHEKMETYTDSTLYFSAKTDYSEAKKSFLESMASDPSKYYSKAKKPAAYLGWDKNKTIASPATGEEVQVEVTKCNDYRSNESIDAFWKTQFDYYAENTSLHIKEKKKFEKYGMQGLDLVFNDTNSIREIKTRMILNNGLLYTINAMIDSVGGMGEWATTFFETFKPADTVIGRSIFTDKVDEFLKDAASKDSTTRDKVSELYENVDLKNKHTAQLMKFIGGPNFSNASMPLKIYLIKQLGDLKDLAIAGFLKKEYPKYVDSASLQLSVLEALANQNTTEGNSAFLQSLLADSPLSSSDDDVTDIFSPFYDSLKLAPALFPQLLQVTKYAEYKSAIYSLMSTLLDSAMIKPQLYEATKKDMLRDANDELKRQITNEENNTGNSSNYKGSNYSNYKSGDSDMDRAMAAAMAAEAAAQQQAEEDANGSVAAPNDLLISYCNLLVPFYAEPATKTFFDKALKTKSPDFQVALVSILIKNNQPVPDTMIEHLSKDMKTRVSLYTELKNNHKLDKMKPEYRSQQSLSQAKIFAEKNIPADSIQFITSRYVESKTQSGYVYFYKSTSKDGSVTLNFYGFQPKDSTHFVTNGLKSSRTVYEKDNINDMVNQVCYELSLKGRKRVSSPNLWGDDYSYDGD